jgi:xanthine dehydrogenase accessory factor
MTQLVVIKSGGDIATGVAHRLHRSGFNVVIIELPQPTVVRRTVSFAQAVFSDEVRVEGTIARKVKFDEIEATMAMGCIPVLVDPDAVFVKLLKPQVVVDGILAKYNTGTQIMDAPVVIGLGPGFTAGFDVHAVVETMRGHDLGRVYYEGAALEDTGIPGEIAGYTVERLLRAPTTGVFSSSCNIGDLVIAGEVVGYVANREVTAAITGILRGLIQDNLVVNEGMKIGDIDPRCRREHCFTISDKARAVAGGVLEAILHMR